MNDDQDIVGTHYLLVNQYYNILHTDAMEFGDENTI